MKFKKDARKSDNYEVRGKAIPMNAEEHEQLERSDYSGPFGAKAKSKRMLAIQQAKAAKSPYLTESTPIKNQKPSKDAEYLNSYVMNSEEGIATKVANLTKVQETAKPTKLNDVVFPKEYKKKRLK